MTLPLLVLFNESPARGGRAVEGHAPAAVEVRDYRRVTGEAVALVLMHDKFRHEDLLER